MKVLKFNELKQLNENIQVLKDKLKDLLDGEDVFFIEKNKKLYGNKKGEQVFTIYKTSGDEWAIDYEGNKMPKRVTGSPDDIVDSIKKKGLLESVNESCSCGEDCPCGGNCGSDCQCGSGCSCDKVSEAWDNNQKIWAIVDVAAQYTDENLEGYFTSMDAEMVADMIKNDFIPKKWHKDFQKSVDRILKK